MNFNTNDDSNFYVNWNYVMIMIWVNYKKNKKVYPRTGDAYVGFFDYMNTIVYFFLFNYIFSLILYLPQ